MGMNIVHKLLQAHIIEGNMRHGTMVGVQADQAHTHQAAAALVFLALEEMNKAAHHSKPAVCYLQNEEGRTRFDREQKEYLEASCRKFGVILSPATNGICPYVHAECFAAPGHVLVGTDPYTPMAGAVGMIAMTAGAMDVATAMAGFPFYFPMPRVIRIHLSGRLSAMVSASDLALEILRFKSLRGHTDKFLEFGGEGVSSLSVSERMTIIGILTELGVRGCVFPSDKQTRQFLKIQNREAQWIAVQADADAEYYDDINVDLEKILPMIAVPHSPDNACPLKDMEGLPLNQVCIGGLAAGSLENMVAVTKILKGKKIAEGIRLYVAPASKQVYEAAAQGGILASLEAAGAVITRPEAELCFGQQSIPVSHAVSLRTACKNTLGSAGSKSARVYLGSPEAAAVSALFGELTDPRKFSSKEIRISMPRTDAYRASVLMPSRKKASSPAAVTKASRIGNLPKPLDFKNSFVGRVVLKVGDRMSTEQIFAAQIQQPSVSNIKECSKHLFESVDGEFYSRAKQARWGVIVAGDHYGQGLMSDHAVLCPLHLGIRVVMARSFEGSHRLGLIHAGILPVRFCLPQDYDMLGHGDELKLKGLDQAIDRGTMEVQRNNEESFTVTLDFSAREASILKAGGLLNFVREGKDDQVSLAYALN